MTAVSTLPISLGRMSMQANTKEWIRQVAQHMGVSLSDLANAAGVAQSTITRYVNDRSNTVGISQRTLDAISAASGFQPGQMPQRRSAAVVADAVPFTPAEAVDQQSWLGSVIVAGQAGRPGREPWIMRSRVVDLAGIHPGDVLIVDAKMAPKPGDIVCARVIQTGDGRMEHVIRRYEPPFLLAHSSLPTVIRPLMVDGELVAVVGVVDLVVRSPRN